MAKKSQGISVFLIVGAIVAIIAGAAFYFGNQHTQEALATEETVTPNPLHKEVAGDHTLGAKDAKVVVVEYASLTCPHCAAFHKQVFKELKKDYIDTGKILFIFRDFPLNEPAMKAAAVAHCSGDERYFKFIDVFFDLQEKWAFSTDFLKDLKTISSVGGVGGEEFDKCIANKDIETKLLNMRQQGAEQLKIEATPTVFINGHALKGGAPYDVVKALIDKELEK